MPTKILACSLGLLSMCWLAGCGSDRSFRCPGPCSTTGGCSSGISGDTRPQYPSTLSETKQTASTDVASRVEIKGTNSAALSWTGAAVPGRLPFEPGQPLAIVTQPSALPSTVAATAAAAPAPLPAITSQEGVIVPQIISIPGACDPGCKDLDKNIVVPVSKSNMIKELPVPIETAKTTPAQRLDLGGAVPAKSAKVESKEKVAAAKHTSVQDGPADHFKLVTGHLQQWRKTWHLRYAEIDREDPFGGSLLLEGMPPASNLRDGQHVRLQGTLVPPENRQDPARYIVQSIEFLD